MNRLAGETSPYLLQHKDNPVDWWPWGPEALAEARKSRKPILLSIGYAACHWCHVMAHESFEDEATAEVMNRLFVNIKVDREERPDIDAIYMQALLLLGQHGGWPLTMFLDPEGRPFWGGTYFPNESRFGQAAFIDILHRVKEVFDQQKDAVTRNAGEIANGLVELARSPDSLDLTPELLDRMTARLLGMVDVDQGGLQGAPKFPQCSVFAFLWRAARRKGETAPRNAVLLTLDRMSQGGIYDHLGGGYARYSVDGEWLAPHFEKMLYDNAQLLELLALAQAETGGALHAARIEETIGWMLREMVAEGGGFASSLDADSEGEEGKYYVWTEAEIDAVLGVEAPPFKAAYDVTSDGNWEGHVILNRRLRPRLGAPEEEARLAASRAKLLSRRDGRTRPGWDDKVLADWNGLAIAALVQVAMQFDRPDWLAAAERAFAFVSERMTRDGDRLCHAARAGRLQTTDLLEDYAAMARAALALHEATGADRPLALAKEWVETVERLFLDPDQGGYFQTASDAPALIARIRQANDNATPSGNGQMGEVLARLWLLTGEEVYRRRAEALLRAFSGEARRNFLGLCTLTMALDLLTAAVQVVIIGQRGDPITQALIRAAYLAPEPLRVLQMIPPGAALSPRHPATGKAQIEGRATAYVCVGTTCSLPVTTAEALTALLRNQRLVS